MEKKSHIPKSILALLLLFSATLIFSFSRAEEENLDSQITEEELVFREQQEFLEEIRKRSSPTNADSINLQGTNEYGEMENLSSLLADLAVTEQTGVNYRETVNRKSVIDINGDGLSDILFHYRRTFGNRTSDYHFAVLLNNGAGQFVTAYECIYAGACGESKSTLSPSFNKESNVKKSTDSLHDSLKILGKIVGSMPGFGSTDPAQTYTFIDLNGDGLTDLLFHNSNNPYRGQTEYHYSKIYLNKGGLNFELSYYCAEKHNKKHNFYEYTGDCAS